MPVSLQENPSNNRYDGLSNEKLQQEYQKQLNIIKSARKELTNLDSAGFYLKEKLTTEVFPAWYGTTWDYNGYTNKPRVGIVACGYFVSTTLKHAGFNVNRYDLAKKYSFSIVKSLCGEPKTYHNTETLYEQLLEAPDALYVVGLSNHVGFLEKTGNNIYFIHSNYMGPVAVEKELAADSDAFNSSNVFVVGNLTGNNDSVSKWLKNEPIKVIE